MTGPAWTSYIQTPVHDSKQTGRHHKSNPSLRVQIPEITIDVLLVASGTSQFCIRMLESQRKPKPPETKTPLPFDASIARINNGRVAVFGKPKPGEKA